MTTTTKCEIQRGVLKACSTMDRHLEPLANQRGKGRLWVVEFASVRDLRAAHVGVAFGGRGGEKRGIMLKFCPWCGASILEESVKPTRALAAAGT